jgi:hypothetical protein
MEPAEETRDPRAQVLELLVVWQGAEQQRHLDLVQVAEILGGRSDHLGHGSDGRWLPMPTGWLVNCPWRPAFAYSVAQRFAGHRQACVCDGRARAPRASDFARR